ncbi:MAG TPA: ornithine cyclodeaminase family protein, partial [Vicinamibacteria bacterium]|nr:ornithine cyclodeaminase family protein [Vicinamibacteria bacterium]
LRQIVRLPAGGFLGSMPAAVGPRGVFGVKALSVFHANEGTAFDSHQGAVLLFEAEHGRLLAIVDATSVTAIRTAAVSAVATRLLAREDAHTLAILGTSVQAHTHLEAIRLVRPLTRVRVFSRDPARVRAFAERESKAHGIEVTPCATAEEAVRRADIVCTVTSSCEPVLRGVWLAEGAHVNVVGAATPECREVDTAAVVRSRVFVDRRESALREAGDLLIPMREGAITEHHVRAELGELLTGRGAGRESAAEVTLFKSLGLAIEDVAAAHVVHRNAERLAVGTRIDLGGRRHG